MVSASCFCLFRFSLGLSRSFWNFQKIFSYRWRLLNLTHFPVDRFIEVGGSLNISRQRSISIPQENRYKNGTVAWNGLIYVPLVFSLIMVSCIYNFEKWYREFIVSCQLRYFKNRSDVEILKVNEEISTALTMERISKVSLN